MIEGSEGGGKRDFANMLGAALDPTHFAVTTVTPDRRRARDGHWLARFWARLPEAGDTAIFYHSWYRRVLEDRLLGLVSDKEWKRAFDEINEFESQQRDYGTLIVKLFFHITDATQERRIAEREADEWRRHLIGPAEFRTPQSRAAYRAALAADARPDRHALGTLVDDRRQRSRRGAGRGADRDCRRSGKGASAGAARGRAAR